MALLDWLPTRGWRWTPAWFRVWQHRQRIAYLKRTVLPDLLAAQEAGVGLAEAWAGSDITFDEILAWYAEQIAQAPRPSGRHWTCSASCWPAAPLTKGYASP